MCPVPTDRRVRRTHELLRTALVSLIQEKEYGRITVQDILDRADVGRSTFYAHFRDKEDLLVSGFEDIRQAMSAERAAVMQAGVKKSNFLEPMLVILEHVEHHRHMWKPIMQKGGSEVIFRTLRDSAESLLRDHLRLHFSDCDDDLQFEASIQFVSGAFMSLLVWWGDNDVALSAAEVHAMFKHLANQGIGGYLTRGR
jgi:AcrR family transcriptional regulator